MVKIICNTAIQDQLIRSKQAELCEQVQSIREPLNSAVSQAAKDCNSFLDAVASAEKFLY